MPARPRRATHVTATLHLVPGATTPAAAAVELADWLRAWEERAARVSETGATASGQWAVTAQALVHRGDPLDALAAVSRELRTAVRRLKLPVVWTEARTEPVVIPTL